MQQRVRLQRMVQRAQRVQIEKRTQRVQRTQIPTQRTPLKL